jgi:hypothetical protein
MKNKKAQIADTIAWVIATVVIIIILILFVFISSMLASARIVNGESKDSLFSKSVSYPTDLGLTKTLITYYTIKDPTLKKSLDKELKKMNSTLSARVDYDARASEILRRVSS